MSRGPGAPKGHPRWGGRKKGTPNKSTAEIKELAAQYGPAAVATLAHLMFNAETEQLKKDASVELLNRGYGRAPQQIQHAGHDGGKLDLTLLGDEDLDNLAIRFSAMIGEDQKVTH